jgi:hypothetical protein
MLDPKDQQTLLTYSVLTALTPLIPVPLVDDIAKGYFRRHLVGALAANHRMALDAQALQALADEARSGSLLGVAGAIVTYPARKIFRKVFYVLEIKRAVDTLSQTYYHGFLVASALQEGLCAPSGPHSPVAVRAAIDAVLAGTDTSLVNRAARGALAQSKTALKGAVGILTNRLRGISENSRPEEVERAVTAAEPEEAGQIDVITARLQALIGEIPREHFEQLRAKLAANLRQP